MIAAIYGRMRRGLWFVAYPVAAIAFVAVVSALVRYRGYSSSEAIYLVTGIVLLAYTIETWRLRREAQLQTELQNRPFLLFYCSHGGLYGEVAIRNVGKGFAVNVSVVTVELGADATVEHVGGPMYLELGEVKTPTLRVVSKEFGPIPPLQSTTTQGHAILLLTQNNPTVHVEYESSVGQRYRTTVILQGTAVALLADVKIAGA